MDKKIFIGQLAKISGIKDSTLDFYVNAGLLDVAGHYGVFRLFDIKESLKRLKKIKKLQSRGFSIKKIKQNLNENNDK